MGEGLDASYAIDMVLAGIGHGAKKNVVSLGDARGAAATFANER